MKTESILLSLFPNSPFIKVTFASFPFSKVPIDLCAPNIFDGITVKALKASSDEIQILMAAMK